MTCDRCELALLCFGGVVDPREVEICHSCMRVLLNHGNRVFMCEDLPQLNAARRPTASVAVNPPPHYCFQCQAGMMHGRSESGGTYYFDLDRNDMVQVDYHTTAEERERYGCSVRRTR